MEEESNYKNYYLVLISPPEVSISIKWYFLDKLKKTRTLQTLHFLIIYIIYTLSFFLYLLGKMKPQPRASTICDDACAQPHDSVTRG